MASYDTAIRISVQCIENSNGNPGVVVYDDKTFPVSLQQDANQGTASGDRQGHHSSVRCYQRPRYQVEDTNMGRGPPTAGNSHTSLEEEVDETTTGVWKLL